MATAGELRTQRKNLKGAVTKHLRDIDTFMAEEDIKGVTDKLEKVRSTYTRIEDLHSRYHELLDDESAIEDSEIWIEDAHDKYNSGIVRARTWLKSVGYLTSVVYEPPTADDDTPSSGDQPSPDPNATAVTETADLINVLSMPKVGIDTFSGNPIEYKTFITVFDEMVGCKVVDDQIKLTRLLQYTSGSAKAAIRNCILIGGSQGYKQARDILKSRFSSDHLVAQKLVSDLKCGKVATKPSELHQLSDDLTMAYAVLESIGMTSEIGGQQCIIDILQRCPPFVRNKWRDSALKYKRENDAYPGFKDFVDFVSRKSSDWDDPVYGYKNSKPLPQKSINSFSGGNISQSPVPQSHDVKPVDKCVLCTGKHRLFGCEKFKAMHPWERVRVARTNRLCFNCLLPKHVAAVCKKPSTCTVPECGKKHTKFLHTGPSSHTPSNVAEGIAQGATENTVTNTTVTNTGDNTGDKSSAENGIGLYNVCAHGSTVYMPIVPILVNGMSVLALLDTGATNTVISDNLATKLKLTGKTHKYVLNTVSQSAVKTSQSVDINVSSVDGTFSEHLKNVLVCSSLPARYPKSEINVHEYSHLSDIPLPRVRPGDRADVIIGMDNGHLLFPLDCKRNPSAPREPYAVRYVFGWCLNGSVGDPMIDEVQSHFLHVDDYVHKFWQSDAHDLDNDVTFSVEDRKVVDFWDSNIYRDNDGHYVLPIPWRDGRPNLPNNKFVAENRLVSLSKRLARSDLTDVYDANIKQMFDSGYAERVPDNELSLNDGSVFYLPHHPVINPSKPGKVRPVFDCAAKFHGVSLNSECFQGPDLVNKLFAVLLRFRQYRYAVTADVEGMYLQVRIPDFDRNALRFLWYDDGKVVEYRMTSHLFGGRWCSASSTYSLRRTVKDLNPSDLISHTILKSFYVDDLLRSCKTIQEATEIIHGVKSTLSFGGFKLTKFTSNNPEILDLIDLDDRAKEVKELVPDTVSKALGIKWDVYEDMFYYVNKRIDADANTTRRTILSHVSSIYDPLGLVSPIVIRGKLIFQEATRLRLSWDTIVPSDLRDRWLSWLSSLSDLNTIKFDRCVLPDGFEDAAVELHLFGDASSLAYGACCYIRAINHRGRIHVALLTAKGRVAPLKCITVPRLELLAAELAVKLDLVVRDALDIHVVRSFFWSDSQIVLAYLNNVSRRFKVFVANRVAYILDHSSPEQWGHVPGDENPADVISRGCLVKDLPVIWTRGPQFLWQYKSDWPHKVSSPPLESTCLESNPDVIKDKVHSDVTVMSSATSSHSELPIVSLIRHYSSFYRLKKAVAWWRRFLFHLKDKKVFKGPVTLPELLAAERCILSHVQSESYREDIASLKSEGHVRKSSPLKKLSPSLSDDLVVVGGRLAHAPLSASSKCPIILPHGHKVSDMIIRQFHDECHVGTEWLLSRLRTRYWIVRARSMIKRVKRYCVICQRLYASSLSQRMADLPPERCQPQGPAFRYVGLDIFGPFIVTERRSQVKRYGCIFTCLTSRAIHIEVLHRLDTDAFLNGFVRFSCRRNYPVKLFCDNGTNLVGAHNELRRCFQDLDRDGVIRHARRHNVEWHFNPPAASHMGGVYERMIRTVRRVLYALLCGRDRLTDEILVTVFCECENIVNSRPLTKLSEDVNDDEALSPNHILLLDPNQSFPWVAPEKCDQFQKRWRHAQFIVNQFWKRWVKQYLLELNQRQKWFDIQPNVKVGNLVFIMDDSIPRGSWPIGRIVEVNSGRDGLVRSARIKTKGSYLVRPITKLILLEGVHYDS